MSSTLPLEKFDPLSLYDFEVGKELKVPSPYEQRLEKEEFEARRARTTVENWRAISNTRERLPRIEPTAERFASTRRHESRAEVVRTALMIGMSMVTVSCAGLAMAVLLHMV